MRIRSVATAAAVVALTVAGAPAATAASFDQPVGGGGRVWYDDGADTLCVSLSNDAGYDVLSMTASPVTAGRGPTRSFTVYRGERSCKSLATAYEDSAYSYHGTLGFVPPCRCGSRFGGDFYS